MLKNIKRAERAKRNIEKEVENMEIFCTQKNRPNTSS
jgi:hypothetical protein